MLKGVLNRAERAQKGAFEGHSFGEGEAMPCRGLFFRMRYSTFLLFTTSQVNTLFLDGH